MIKDGQGDDLVGGVVGHNFFDRIISLENLFAAWAEFSSDKASRPDVQAFALRLEDNVFDLHHTLKDGKYRHGSYEEFIVCDPKRRIIHKASVADRLVHHALVRVLEPIFDRQFIFDSWSCRKGKGTHAAVDRLERLAWKLSQNNTRTVWALKLDIKKYFASVDQNILLRLLDRRVVDPQTRRLVREIVGSFSPGLPLGNLTSQLFANIYLHELDVFVKHTLRHRTYLRYCDDFVLLHCDPLLLERHLAAIERFLADKLKLALHPDKRLLAPFHRGIDFLGYVCFYYFRVLRPSTGRRLLRKVAMRNLSSYNGVLAWCRSSGIRWEAVEKLSGCCNGWWREIIMPFFY